MELIDKEIKDIDKLLETLDDLIEKTLDELYSKDSYLLENEVHERTIVFRFGLYLQALMDKTNKFNEYNLDFEYNRNGDNPKRLPCRPYGAVPDLIVHQRGSNKYNLLVMEFKPYWETDTEADLKNLSNLYLLKGSINILVQNQLSFRLFVIE